MKISLNSGVYPTMITPYSADGTVDFEAALRLVDWYWEKGCDGIFAVCQSSEIFWLSLRDRVRLAQLVRRRVDELGSADHSRKPMTVVVSGHISPDPWEQAEELRRMAETRPDALILISNRMDMEQSSDQKWISDTERLIAELPPELPLGLYECPHPYKRLLSDAMLEWCAGTQRFYFMKDTCCDATRIRRRLKILEGSHMMLLNANSQTLLDSLKNGGSGYCGVMSNFHPEIFGWLCRNFRKYQELAERVQAFLGITAFTETLAYPCTAKYYLNQYEHIPMTCHTRMRSDADFGEYDRICMGQLRICEQQILTELKQIEKK